MKHLPDSGLHLESMTELSGAKAQNFMGGERTPHRKNVASEGGGHRTHTL